LVGYNQCHLAVALVAAPTDPFLLLYVLMLLLLEYRC
jgi:hypothetical protein